MKNSLLVLLSVLFVGCAFKAPKTFSEKALNDTFLTLEGDTVKFQHILEKYKGKKILINVWASWCRDCLEALPEERKISKEYPEVIFLHLSLDKEIESWKRGIERLNIEGEHYFMKSGWEGDFGNFLKLNWIPRYLVLNRKGEIELFKATRPSSKLIIEGLKK